MTINGKVDYRDSTQGGNPIKGAYGVRVVLLFHALNTIGPCAKNPFNLVLSHPLSGCTEHTHYCKVDTGGNFSFNFMVSTGGLWSSHYYDFVLLVTNWNDADSLTGDDHDMPHSSEINTYLLSSSQPCGDWSVFREAYSQCFSLYGVGSTFTKSGVEIRLNSIDGPILRNGQFCQDYYRDRPIGSAVPARIRVKIPDPNIVGNSEGTYTTSDSIGLYIVYEPAPNFAATIDHEYGHYVQYGLWGGFNGDGKIDEGWANFFQFAVRNYVNKRYGDDLIGWKTNDEEMPFDTFPTWIGRWSFNPNINAYPDTTTYYYALADNLRYNVCASFLWNVYDSYSDSGFKASIYDNADNDDVGEPLLIFETALPSSPNNTIIGFRDALKAAVDSEEAVSIQKIYDCMFTDSTGLNPTVLMRPAQVKDLSGNIDEMPHPGCTSNCYSLSLSWTSQAYTTGSFINPASGIHVYQSDGSGGWNLVATISGSATNYSYGHYSEAGPFVFKVSAFDSSGDSYNPPTVTCTVSSKISNGKPDVVSNTVFTLESANPNPFKDRFDVNFNLQSGSVINYEVLNSLGETVISDKMAYDSPGEKHLQINSAKLPSGLYVVRLFTIDPFGQPSYQTLKVTKIQ